MFALKPDTHIHFMQTRSKTDFQQKKGQTNMKDRLFIVICFLSAAFLLPVFFTEAEAVETVAAPETVRVYITETEEIRTLTWEEYLVGCLAAQIPLDYEQEALSAQAAAAMTYAQRLMLDLKDSGEIPDGADISDSTSLCQPYYTPEKCAEIYGGSYEEYLPNLKAAAQYGEKHIITFENEPIYAVYHSVSAGATNTAEGIWGRSFSYLESVDSSWDRSYINYECRNEMTAEEARLCLVSYKDSIETPADYSKWFTEFNADENGYVISVKIGENIFSGGDIWRIFGLRSTAFTVEYESGIFTFVTKGYGHGAGLSQYGADQMARAGRTASEILRHYYGESVTF